MAGRNEAESAPLRETSAFWDGLAIMLVWAAAAFVSLYVEPNYDEFSTSELLYYSVYNVAVGASIGFYLLDRISHRGYLRFAVVSLSLILAGTLINEAFVEPLFFSAGPINAEGLYHGLVDALTITTLFLLLRLARGLHALRKRVAADRAIWSQLKAKWTRRPSLDAGLFFVRAGGETRRLFAADVLYLEAEKDFTRVVCSNGEHFVSESLKSLLERCASLGIVRIHKSFAVNLARVERLTRTQACLGNCRVPIGRTYWETFADRWESQTSKDTTEDQDDEALEAAQRSALGPA